MEHVEEAAVCRAHQDQQLIEEQGWETNTAEVNGIQLGYVAAGKGPLVVLLHGFPESWYAWRHQIGFLANLGFRVVAPDLRGYARSGRPSGVQAYHPDQLVEDISQLITSQLNILEFENESHQANSTTSKAVVIGHDWGAGIAWWLAMKRPDLLEKLVILNGPHPERFRTGLWTWQQIRRSWYIFFFQLPWLPEWFLRRKRFKPIRKLLKTDGFSPEDIEIYIQSLAQPGVLTAAINYYRAMMRSFCWGQLPKSQVIPTPTLILWGEPDSALGSELATPDPVWVPHAQVEMISANHWVQTTAAGEVNRRLAAFLKR